jgi:hypothetical protein
VGDVVRLDGSDYVLAQADDDENAEVVGIVQAVADANNFTVQVSGYITGLAGLTAGAVFYLSAGTPGALTATEPSSLGDVSKPVLIADTTTSGWIFNMRGFVVSAGGGGGGAGLDPDDENVIVHMEVFA